MYRFLSQCFFAGIFLLASVALAGPENYDYKEALPPPPQSWCVTPPDTKFRIGLPGWLAYFSAAAEFFGGILVIAGLWTRVAAAAILINMVVTIAKVHWKNGLLGNGGYQFPLALAAIAFALIFCGAGPIALDNICRGGPGKLKKG